MKILLLIIIALALLGLQYVIIDKLMSKAVQKPKDYQLEDEEEEDENSK
ncbi:MAG: hypothetical protein KBT36_08465 [Kurthia sp.]|nr:hypothetical protein [Candidatus Kurthia equi]